MDTETALTRRAFLAGTAGAAGVLALGAGTLPALADPGFTPATPLLRAAGVAVVGRAPKALCLLDGRWVLVGEDGRAVETTGLSGATVLDVTTDGDGALAAGSVRTAAGPEATLWQSADGRAWREVHRLTGTRSEFSAVGSGRDSALVLGSLLSGEGVPRSTVAARRVPGGWAAEPVSGLEATSERPLTTLSADSGQWLAAAVGRHGSTLYRSATGVEWTELATLPDAAVRALLAHGGQVRWVGNALGGSAALTGTVGGGRAPAAVRQDAHAVGAVRGPVSYWLLDGRLVATGI